MKKLITLLALLLTLVLILASCAGEAGPKGEQGERGEQGEPGVSPTVSISTDGYWIINGEKTATSALGKNGAQGPAGRDGATVEISSDGYWIIDGTITNVKALGETVRIQSCEKTAQSADGLFDTYTMTYSDGTSVDFNVQRNATLVITVEDITFARSVTEGRSVYSVYKVSFTDGYEYEISMKTSYFGETVGIATSHAESAFTGTLNDFVIGTFDALIDTFGRSSSLMTHIELITIASPKLISEWGTYFTATESEVKVRPEIGTNDVYTIVKAIGAGGSAGSAEVSDVIVSSTLGAESIYNTTDRLAKGNYLFLEENHVLANKQLTLSFKKSSFSSSDVIRLGHGETSYGGAYLELTATEIRVYSHYTSSSIVATLNHGLTLTDYVNISIDQTYAKAVITVGTASGVYKSEPVSWGGQNGKIFATTLDSEINDVKMRWGCRDFSSEVWIFGDSYISTNSSLRWSSYLISNGYTELLLSAYPGRNTATALNDFKTLLAHATPKYAVWCMGMNDADGATAINASYKSATEEFLRICAEKGITPILTTTPNVPERNMSFKNEWVKSSGYRYIDFARAVGGEETGSSWYDGMLYSDKVHPDALGAYAMYVQCITDFPEIMETSGK